MQIAKLGMRAKFLLVRLSIAVALTTVVILVVRYQFGSSASRKISGEMRECQQRYESLEAQRDAIQAQTAAVLAETPAVIRSLAAKSPSRQVMPLPDFARKAGTDFAAIANGQGTVAALMKDGAPWDWSELDRLSAEWPSADARDAVWPVGGKLFRVHRDLIGSEAAKTTSRGAVIVGSELGARFASEMGAICSCDVAFVYGDTIVASTLDGEKARSLSRELAGSRKASSVEPAVLRLGEESYRVFVIPISTPNSPAAIVTLKSHEATRLLQSEFTRLMVLLAIVAMVIGFVLVLRVSDTFAKPLGNLVAAVRALEKGDYSYPVKVHSGDELAEVTQSFDQMRSSLRETQHELLKNERLATIGRMASSISHDLRHQFTSIVANSEFLSEDGVSSEQRHSFYQEIRVAIDQLNDLVESLLEFSRGREEPRLVMVNLEDVVERAVRTIRARPEFQAVELRVECPAPIECMIDPSKIARALNNLLVNSCEAVAHGAGHVDVSVCVSRGFVEILVADNGPGVPATVRESLFQPFVSYGKANGTGLGLAIVQKVCRDHGGDAVLESSEVGRTVFKLTIPSGR
jgi:signal transduction histidine kinase